MQGLSTKSKQFKLNQLNFFAIPLMAFAGLAAIGILAINQDVDPSASASNSTAITGTISYEDEYITISNSSQVDLGTMNVTADSTYAYATDNVTVSTNVPTGYDLYLSSADNSSSALTTPSSYTQIAATSGTGGDGGTPKVLDADSYGYAISKDIMTGDGLTSNFDSSYTAPNSSSKWAGVPAGTQDRLRSTSTATSDSGDTTEVHYGANVTNYLAPGTYSGSVVYSAVVTPSSNTVEMSVSPNSGMVGTELTIISGPVNTISTSHHLASGDVEVQFQQNGVVKGVCVNTDTDPSNGYLITTCSVPGGLAVGSYDVVIIVPRFGFKDSIPNGYISNNNLSHVPTTMQDADIAKYCSIIDETISTSSYKTYTLTDIRNSQDYYIRQFDLNGVKYCIMVENLYLPSGTNLNSNDSNVIENYIIPASTTRFGTSGTGAAVMFDGGRHRIYGGETDGSYYGWSTAMAGNGSGSSYDICPKYWHLPTKNEAEYIVARVNAIGINTFFADRTGSVNTPIYSGYYNGSSSAAIGRLTYWYTNLETSSSDVNTIKASNETLSTSSDQKYNGFPIRCLVQAAS